MTQQKNPFESDKPVYFNLGDTGVEVSNDPRYFDEQYREKVLEEMENTGRATRHDADVAAELGTGNPVGTMDGLQAQQPGLPVTIVGDTRNAGQTDEKDELLEKDESDMTVDELKAHVAELKEQGVEVDTSGITKKSELVKRVKAAKKKAAKDAEDSGGQ